MKYLNKTFSVYPAVHIFTQIEREVEEYITKRTRGLMSKRHDYTDLGGMCRWCALDAKGCAKKQEAK